jgi:hypothetical protein
LKKAGRVCDVAYEAKQYNAAMSAIKETGVLSGKRRSGLRLISLARLRTLRT